MIQGNFLNAECFRYQGLFKGPIVLEHKMRAKKPPAQSMHKWLKVWHDEPCCDEKDILGSH